MRNAKKPEHTTRNLFIGYTFVFFSYVIIGGLGYIGFIGTLFQPYFKSVYHSEHSGEIAQNCLNMFGYIHVLSFMIRLAIFMLLFSTYPLLNLFLRTHLLNLFYERKEMRKRDLVILNLVVTLIPLVFAILEPTIGSIIAYSGACAGFIIIYCLPVMVFLKKKYLQITNPILAEAIELNQFRVVLRDASNKDGHNEPQTNHNTSSLTLGNSDGSKRSRGTLEENKQVH